MSSKEPKSREELNLALQNYIKLARQPHLSAGARAVLQLQIIQIQEELQNGTLS